MDISEWEKLRDSLEKLAPSIRIRKYSELLRSLDSKDKNIFEDVLALIEKASIEESFFVESSVKSSKKELSELVARKEEPTDLTEKVEEAKKEEKLDDLTKYTPAMSSESDEYIKKVNPSESESEYYASLKIETETLEIPTSEEDFYKSDVLKKNKEKKEKIKPTY